MSDELRQLAEAALAGDVEGLPGAEDTLYYNPNEIGFSAATILALLDERDRLTAALTVEAIAKAMQTKLQRGIGTHAPLADFMAPAAALRAALLPEPKETT